MDSKPTLDEWVATLSAELHVDVDAVPTGLLLDVARVVAHAIARPAAPVTTFVMGMAVAQQGSTHAMEEIAVRVCALAESMTPDESAP